MATYTVRTVLMDGSSPVTAASAIPETITRTLNEPDQAAMSWPKHAYPASALPVLGGPSASIPSGAAEVQIFRDTTLQFWGPILSVDTAGDNGAVTADLAGVDWYLLRRFVDGARTNLVTNPSFESGTSGWSATNCTAAATADTKILGTSSARLSSPTAADAFLGQSFSVTGTAIGTLLTAVGYFLIESITGQALESRGLYIEGHQAGIVRDNDYYPIDSATPAQLWTRAEITIWVPPNETWTINVRLYAPPGSILWDAVQVVAMESVSTAAITLDPFDEVDVADIFALLVAHVQNAAVGKSNVNIGYTATPSGVTAVKHYQYADHVQFDEALHEFIDRDDFGDYSIVYAATANGTSGTRTFTLHNPQLGSDLSGATTLSFPGNIANYRYQRDGSSVVTRATVLGEGDGPDREEGEYADASQIGGLILQEVRSAPQQTQINSLLPQATDIVNPLREPVDVLEIQLVPSPDLVNTIDVGDIVALDIADGYVTKAGDYRIVQWELECRTDVLNLTLNKVV
jgi:hypothetical protein